MESRSFARIAARFRKSSKVGASRSTFRDVTRRRREQFRRRTRSRLGATLLQRFGTTTLTRKRSPEPQGNASNVIRFKTSPSKPPRSLTTSCRIGVAFSDITRRCDAASLFLLEQRRRVTFLRRDARRSRLLLVGRYLSKVNNGGVCDVV